MKTSDYSRAKTLLIPQAFERLSDASCLTHCGDLSIYRRKILNNIEGVEFYTDLHCIAYILQGKERFTSFNNESVVLKQGDLLFIPKKQYLISDYKNDEGPLEALLFFFSDLYLKNWLLNRPADQISSPQRQALFYIHRSSALSIFMTSLLSTAEILKDITCLADGKLHELLTLMDFLSPKREFRNFVTSVGSENAKRNILHVLSECKGLKLSIAELAELSGRSLSSFQRDFKKEFKQSPGQWLQKQRLLHAHALIQNTKKSITEIAFDTGYESVSHFIKKYSDCFGQTPGQSRKFLNLT
ncbi:MAG: AraC family transcriptional regulator [Sneathiellales bacterium]|nr:AraC family transcriptional regulator [Sneathiellales bacterium]